jgi:N-acetylglutamate synthase/N-acetylornithine aminotransferase
MIAPDMATMLCYVATDARIPAGAPQALLKKGVDASFNCATVDSDTSTSVPCFCSPPVRQSIPGFHPKAADRDKLSIGVGGVWMARDGGAVAGYGEVPVVADMKRREVAIGIDLGLGRGKATVWTCDLTHGYIDINGSYRN